MRRSLLTSVIVAFGLFALLTTAKSIHAQDDPQPSRDPNVFKAQLQEFILITKKNLRDIQALPVDDSIPVDPQVRGNAHRAYKLIRAAQWGMGLAIERQPYQDPILGLAQKRVTTAWHLARFPVDNTNLSSRSEYINTSVQNLSSSLKLVQQALVMIP